MNLCKCTRKYITSEFKFHDFIYIHLDFTLGLTVQRTLKKPSAYR